MKKLFLVLMILLPLIVLAQDPVAEQPVQVMTGVWGMVIGFVFGVIIPLILANFLPNEKFYKWGYAVGIKMSAAGNKFLGKNYEAIENNLTGSILFFAQGVKEGAAKDNK